MAEIWAAAVATVGAGYLSSRASSRNQKDQIAADKETARVQAEEGRRTTAYEMELADFYGQQNKSRRRDARAGVFDKHSQIAKPEGFERKPIMIARPTAPPPIVDPIKGKK